MVKVRHDPGVTVRIPASLPPFFWRPGEGDEPEHSPGVIGQVIGHDGGTFLVIDSDGSIGSVDPQGLLDERFVNTTASHFEASLRLFAEAWTRREALTDSEARDQVASLRVRLTDLDDESLAHSENWWAVILEQLETRPPIAGLYGPRPVLRVESPNRSEGAPERRCRVRVSHFTTGMVVKAPQESASTSSNLPLS
jgi:SUKH-4 immunity protein